VADSIIRWDPFRDLVSIQDKAKREESKPRKIEVKATA
jgi:hypothetical protein